MYKQVITPNIDISATAGMCLQYVDDALNVKWSDRTGTAQIAYNECLKKGWIQNNQNFPDNVWVVVFWSIDNTAQKGLGHVAFLKKNKYTYEIHDSEVHRGARKPYKSFNELYNWFGSANIKMSFLGWSLGVDNVKIIEDEKENEVLNMNECLVVMKDNFQAPFLKDRIFLWSNTKGFQYLEDIACVNFLNNMSIYYNGKKMYVVESTKGSPWHARITQINGEVDV